MTRANVRRLGAAGRPPRLSDGASGTGSRPTIPQTSMSPQRASTEGAQTSSRLRYADPVPEGGYTLAYSVTHGKHEHCGLLRARQRKRERHPHEARPFKVTLQLAQDALDEVNENVHAQRVEGRRRIRPGHGHDQRQ